MSLEQLYEEMSEHTKGECAKCRVPRSCCSPEYCEMAAQWAKDEYGIELVRTNHPRLPFMGYANGESIGCTVAPHLRPLCTLHVCSINSIGTSGNKAWDDRYFNLLDRLMRLEYLRATRELEAESKETENDNGAI